MSNRGWLAVTGGAILAAALSVLRLFAPRAWQIGGIGPLPFTVGYAGLLLGLVALVFALPRRMRVCGGAAVLAALVLFVALWPSWEGRMFPYKVSSDQLLAILDPHRTGRIKLYVYATWGSGWLAGVPEASGQLPAEGRIIGFYAEGLTLRGRLEWILTGFTLRPVWPGYVYPGR